MRSRGDYRVVIQVPPSKDSYLRLSRGEFRHLVESIENRRGVTWPMQPAAEETDRRRLAAGDEVYLLLSHLLDVHSGLVRASRRRTLHDGNGPYILGITGSVAVGKSTTSEILRDILSTYPHRRDVELVTTDSFLYPNHILESHGKMDRKGFPESFDVARLLSFLSNIRQGLGTEQAIPVYSHAQKDIVAGEFRAIRRSEILILEGVNILSDQFSYFGNVFSISDFLDCSIFLDADTDVVRRWFFDRFAHLRETSQQSHSHYFGKIAAMDDTQFQDYITNIWYSVNVKLLNEAILPKQYTADIILKKNRDHFIEQISMSDSFRSIFMFAER